MPTSPQPCYNPRREGGREGERGRKKGGRDRERREGRKEGGGREEAKRRKDLHITISNIHHDVMQCVTLERMISGARYSGVPQRVHVRPFTRFAKPKSVI